MTVSRIDPEGARRIVEARLDRPPQDMLEAAVVLEAWVGVPARDALGLGTEMLRTTPAQPVRSRGPVPDPPDGRGVWREALPFALVVLAIGGWAGPLAGTLGIGVIELALGVALPLTMALQWGLSSRYLSRPEGLALLARDARGHLAAPTLLVAVPGLALGVPGIVAGLLTLTWVGGAILVRRGWSVLYAALVVLAAVAMTGGLWPPAILGLLALVTSLLAAVAVLSGGAPPTHQPGRLGRACTATLIGLGLGLLLVADRSVNWSFGALPAVALLPATLACYWSGTYLWRFQQVIPRVLRGVSAADTRAPDLGRGPRRILLGAIARLVALTAAISGALLGTAALTDASVGGVTVLAGFGMVAMATLVLGLLESVGRPAAALCALSAGIGADVLASQLAGAHVAGAGLIAGSALAVVVALPFAFSTLGDPVTTLATRLGIP